MKLKWHIFLWLFIVVGLGIPPAFAQAEESTEDEMLASEGELIFVKSVFSTLKTKCFACHGGDPEEIKGGLDLTSRAGAIVGGDSTEASLVPGVPDESPLYLASIRDSYWSPMPPKENDALAEQQLASLRRWIEVGAPWPSDERFEEIKSAFEKTWDAEGGMRVATSGGLDADWTTRRYEEANLWAYQPLWRDEAGLLKKHSSQNPIDVLLGERFNELGIQPAPSADRLTLIRRATFDLTGLPPTPAEVEEFLNDSDDEVSAFAKVVERLLASPHYGEKWGQHWLDVTRYADSSGFANDYERGSAWRYRDYVVRSFNEDKPYDQFVREQIAGDEIDPTDPENLVAVGFLRMGPWELTGMEVAKVARQRFLDDATDAIGQVFLGHMLQCAKCHDHKFDPVPTRDYYSIQAAFATTQLTERFADFLPEENTSSFEEKNLLLERKQYYRRQLAELNDIRIEAARAWFLEEGIDGSLFEKYLKSSNGQYDGARRKLMQNKKYPAKHVPGRHIGFDSRTFGLERVARKGLARLSWQLDRYEPVAFSVYSGHTPDLKNVQAPLRMPKNRMRGELEASAILAGGDTFSPAEPVEPGLLSAVASFQEDAEYEEDYVLPGEDFLLFPNKEDAPVTGRRTALADWIASAENPLTARVMVNRIWQGHFGKAIAGNPNNFGATGKKPTHPRLLDWLAAEFVRQGWSVKAMHRVMMLSDAYRRASFHPFPGHLSEADPNLESFAVFMPRRLTAEELRDTMLAVSGELNLEIGGIPVRPEINMEAALQPRMVMGTFAEAWQPSILPEDRHRRSIYCLKLRGLRDPFFEVFNAPPPDLSTERRDTSTVTPQVFSLFNGQATFGRALAMAERLMHRKADQDGVDATTIEAAFQLAFSRKPSQTELDACLQHWEKMTAVHREIELEPAVYPHEIVREAVDENTGEKFVFTEPLEAMKVFTPDLQPSEVSPKTRGLAEVCLILMNSNEFAYVY
ncbi:Planctomycete cytochrome C [Planctomycetales bacterium 10988]|nr:Planctomycete cytochrome C [Planctomycetales bacterium 10988]